MVVGIFVGVILGSGVVGLEWVEVVQRVGIGGRAWVSSLPNFFLGKHSQFWKLPPYLCINNRDNVYYPIFLACYIVRIINIKYAVLCIISVCASVKMVSKMSGFYLGKARVGVLSLPHPSPILFTKTKNPYYHNNLISTTASNTAVTASTNLAIIFTRYHTIHSTDSLKTLKYYI